jgi:hypothetical protein
MPTKREAAPTDKRRALVAEALPEPEATDD